MEWVAGARHQQRRHRCRGVTAEGIQWGDQKHISESVRAAQGTARADRTTDAPPPQPRPHLCPQGHSARFSARKGQGAVWAIKCADLRSLILLLWAKKMKRSWFNSASKYLEKKE